jgi:hypothetical protein
MLPVFGNARNRSGGMGNNWMELGLTKDEEEFVRRGAELYKITYLDTIDNIFVIARSIKILHDRYHGSGIRGGFTDALVQYGFTARDGGPMNKAIRSHLSQLLAHEAEVRAWWEKVPERVKRDWLSAKAIHRHWTNSKKPADAPRKPSPYAAATNIELQEQLHKATKLAELEAENHGLKAKLAELESALRKQEEPTANVTRWQAEPEARPQETEAESESDTSSSDLDDAIDVILDHLETLEPREQMDFVDHILSPLGLASRQITRRGKLTWKPCGDGDYRADIMKEHHVPFYHLAQSLTDEKLYGVAVCFPANQEILVDMEKEPLPLAEAKKFAEARHAERVDT